MFQTVENICRLTVLQCDLKDLETVNKEENLEMKHGKRKYRERLERYIVSGLLRLARFEWR